MNNYLSILFLSLKFYYYYYNIILYNSKRVYLNNFFKNNVFVKKSLNLNFYLNKFWVLNNKQSWYYLGFTSILFTFKTKSFFFKYLNNYFNFYKNDSLFDNFLISSDSLKNSKKNWKYKYASFFLNIFDWSLFFKKNLNKSKFLFLFASNHPLQNLSFRYFKKYDFDEYNDDNLDFNLDISENSSLNYNKNFLLSEFFFFNNKLEYDLDIDNSFFLFFFIKSNPSSNLLNYNKNLFKFTVFFNFYYLVFYPYYFTNNSFFLDNSEDSRLTNSLYFDNFFYPIESSILLFGLNLNYIYLKKKKIMFLNYLSFMFLLNIMYFYGFTEKKKKYYN